MLELSKTSFCIIGLILVIDLSTNNYNIEIQSSVDSIAEIWLFCI